MYLRFDKVKILNIKHAPNAEKKKLDQTGDENINAYRHQI